MTWSVNEVVTAIQSVLREVVTASHTADHGGYMFIAYPWHIFPHILSLQNESGRADCLLEIKRCSPTESNTQCWILQLRHQRHKSIFMAHKPLTYSSSHMQIIPIVLTVFVVNIPIYSLFSSFIIYSLNYFPDIFLMYLFKACYLEVTDIFLHFSH